MNLKKKYTLDSLQKEYYKLRAICANTKRSLLELFHIFDGFMEKEPDSFFGPKKLKIIKDNIAMSLDFFEGYIDQIIKEEDLMEASNALVLFSQEIYSNKYRKLLSDRFVLYGSKYPNTTFVGFVKKIKNIHLDQMAKRLDVSEQKKYTAEEYKLFQILIIDSIELGRKPGNGISDEQYLMFRYLKKVDEKVGREKIRRTAVEQTIGQALLLNTVEHK